jgi:hypothetical protein
MKRLNQALLALFLACGVYAEGEGMAETSHFISYGPVVANIYIGPHSLGELDGAPRAQATTEVVVSVNEDGDTIRTKTNRVTAAPTLQETVSR